MVCTEDTPQVHWFEHVFSTLNCHSEVFPIIGQTYIWFLVGIRLRALFSCLSESVYFLILFA